jgi:hypothetical protein
MLRVFLFLISYGGAISFLKSVVDLNISMGTLPHLALLELFMLGKD